MKEVDRLDINFGGRISFIDSLLNVGGQEKDFFQAFSLSNEMDSTVIY